MWKKYEFVPRKYENMRIVDIVVRISRVEEFTLWMTAIYGKYGVR